MWWGEGLVELLGVLCAAVTCEKKDIFLAAETQTAVTAHTQGLHPSHSLLPMIPLAPSLSFQLRRPTGAPVVTAETL